jgi:hypothetical protein
MAHMLLLLLLLLGAGCAPVQGMPQARARTGTAARLVLRASGFGYLWLSLWRPLQ